MASFRSRILWLLLAVTVVVQVSTVTALVVQTNRRAQEQAGADLVSSGKVLDALLSSRDQRFQQAVTVLAADYGFRVAVTVSDKATIVSAL